MLPLRCVSFRDSKGGDGLRRPLWPSRVKRKTIAEESYEWVVSPSIKVKA
jgi:hypothetical protein